MEPTNHVHVGSNISKFRRIRGLSQGALAAKLEEKRRKPVSQQLISDIESRPTIEDEELLNQIAQILEVEPELLKTVDLDDAINIIGNIFHDNASQQINYKNTVHNSPTFSNSDRVVELLEKAIKENESLRAEIMKLLSKKS
jgi:transcriptional regulator with XRE-family HTH domain